MLLLLLLLLWLSSLLSTEERVYCSENVFDDKVLHYQNIDHKNNIIDNIVVLPHTHHQVLALSPAGTAPCHAMLAEIMIDPDSNTTYHFVVLVVIHVVVIIMIVDPTNLLLKFG